MLIVPDWIIIAVLCLAACIFPRFSHQFSARSTHHSGNHTDYNFDWSHEAEELQSVEYGGRWLNHREAQMVLRKEGGEEGLPVECCPSVLEMVEPKGGTNQDGMLVELFSDSENRQRFFELSCRNGVEGKPCRFMDRRLHNQSVCVQKYSYTYALVREPESVPHTRSHTPHRPNQLPSLSSAGSNWKLDHIRVRSGCSCEVFPKGKRRRGKSKKKKIKRTETSYEDT